MIVENNCVTVNVAAGIDETKKVLRNYNGELLKEDEVLVPMIQSADFISENVTNPECITVVGRPGAYFPAVLTAIPKTYEAAVRSQNNLMVNEALGHYWDKGALSMDQARDDYDLDLASAPSAEDISLGSSAMDSFREYISPLLAKSPKHAYAYLLRLTGIQGKEFETLMHLGHDAANTIRKDVDPIVKLGIKNYDVTTLKANKSHNADYYLQAAYELLDQLMDLI